MINSLRSLTPRVAFTIAALGLPHFLAAADSSKPAAAKPDYPLTVCVVSGDKLDSAEMGGPVDYIYKQPGKPDRLIRFCCKDCIKDFKKEPEKYLKKIDEAAAAKTASEPEHKHEHPTPKS